MWEVKLTAATVYLHQGAMGLENSRPVGLLELLQKASYAFDYATITEVWEEGGLHNSQYASRAKKGTEGPLLLWSLMNDRACLQKEGHARGQGDLKHAYDGVHQWAVEVVLRRMGVPEEYDLYSTRQSWLCLQGRLWSPHLGS